MKRNGLLFAGLLGCVGLFSGCSSGGGRVEGLILDDITGQPLASRVAITNKHGQFIEIEGKHAHVEYLGKRWCYVDGKFEVDVPDGGAGIEVRRGLETRPLGSELSSGAKGSTIQRTFRLRRWIDMRQKGYLSGDLHAHLPIPNEATLQMRAEDLNEVTLLHLADPENSIPVNRCFSGRVDAVSVPGCEVRVTQEVQDWQMGHLTLLNLTNLLTSYSGAGGVLEYWRSRPNWDLGRWARAAREQSGVIFWSHFCSLPGAQSPIGIALGWVDGIELVTWNDPTLLPNHWGPWDNSGMSRAEFPVMRALDLYYQFLNAGFLVPIGAGTDKFYEEIPLGSNRVYGRVETPGSYAGWIEAVKAGKAFVSNGPILEFEAGGHESGDVVEFEGSKRCQAKVTARSILPFTTLEIVVNGETVGHKTLPVQKNPPVDGVYSMAVETEFELSRSSWVAARVAEHPDLPNRVLPRDISVFAHTAPVYFLKDGRKVREEASIAYLCKYVQGVLHWLDSNPKFISEEDLVQSRRSAGEALKVYQSL